MSYQEIHVLPSAITVSCQKSLLCQESPSSFAVKKSLFWEESPPQKLCSLVRTTNILSEVNISVRNLDFLLITIALPVKNPCFLFKIPALLTEIICFVRSHYLVHWKSLLFAWSFLHRIFRVVCRILTLIASVTSSCWLFAPVLLHLLKFQCWVWAAWASGHCTGHPSHVLLFGWSQTKSFLLCWTFSSSLC